MGGGRNLCDAFPLKSPISVNGKSLIDSDASIFTVEEQSCDSNVDWQSSSFSSSRAFGTTFETFGAGDAEQQSEDFNSFIQSYCSWRPPSRSLDDAKLAILRHKPGDWIEKVGGLGAEDYDIPERTTLLLIGPRSSGKSCLVNKITRVFDDDPSASDRAQVSYSGSAEGTCFLQEYPIPRNSSSLCLYDTRSLSIVPSDNFKLLERWMNEGVSHGEPVILDSDDVLLRNKMQMKAAQLSSFSCIKRAVNFAIFVVNGFSILISLKSHNAQYIDIITQSFTAPSVGLRDVKPVVVMTHGDKLSPHDRAFVRMKLGEILGIPPSSQIFDICCDGEMDYVTEAAIVDMLRFCIEHADRNLPLKHTNQASESLKRIWNKWQNLDVFDALVEVMMLSLCLCILVRILVLLTQRKMEVLLS